MNPAEKASCEILSARVTADPTRETSDKQGKTSAYREIEKEIEVLSSFFSPSSFLSFVWSYCTSERNNRLVSLFFRRSRSVSLTVLPNIPIFIFYMKNFEISTSCGELLRLAFRKLNKITTIKSTRLFAETGYS